MSEFHQVRSEVLFERLHKSRSPAGKTDWLVERHSKVVRCKCLVAWQVRSQDVKILFLLHNFLASIRREPCHQTYINHRFEGTFHDGRLSGN